MSAPEMNVCSKGIAVDAAAGSGCHPNRQLKKEEEVQTSMMSVGGAGGIGNVSVKTTGNTDLRTTDAFKLEIFDGEGVLLARSRSPTSPTSSRRRRPAVPHRPRARVTVYQYRIVEK